MQIANEKSAGLTEAGHGPWRPGRESRGIDRILQGPDSGASVRSSRNNYRRRHATDRGRQDIKSDPAHRCDAARRQFHCLECDKYGLRPTAVLEVEVAPANSAAIKAKLGQALARFEFETRFVMHEQSSVGQ